MKIEKPISRTICGRQGSSLLLPRTAACLLSGVMVVLLLAVTTTSLSAKRKGPPTKTVSGFVLDEADNGVPDAAVKLTDLQTGKKMAAYSQEGGRYQFSGLDPHHDYEVKAIYKGATSEVRQVSSVDERMRIVINLTIPGLKLQ